MSPSDADVTELPSSPGARLRREREAQGISHQQAAESLNLDTMVLAHLEANDFATLGAPVFVKGHLRRYTTMLGLDEDEIVSLYEHSKQQLGEPSLVPKSRLEMAPVRGKPRWPWVVGGAATFFIASALLAYLSEHGLPWVDTTPEEPTAPVLQEAPATTMQAPAAAASTPAIAGISRVSARPSRCSGIERAATRPGQPAFEVRCRFLGRGVRRFRQGGALRSRQGRDRAHAHGDRSLERDDRRCRSRRRDGQWSRAAGPAACARAGARAFQHRSGRVAALNSVTGR